MSFVSVLVCACVCVCVRLCSCLYVVCVCVSVKVCVHICSGCFNSEVAVLGDCFQASSTLDMGVLPHPEHVLARGIDAPIGHTFCLLAPVWLRFGASNRHGLPFFGLSKSDKRCRIGSAR